MSYQEKSYQGKSYPPPANKFPDGIVADDDFLLVLRSYLNKPGALLRALGSRSPAEIAGAIDSSEKDQYKRLVEKDRQWLEHACHHLVLFGDREYPDALRDIDDPPPAIWIDGNRECLVGLSLNIAVVGSRKASQYARLLATEISTDLARQGAVVTSGLALGIDAAAHEGALIGNGVTLAVLGSGCDEVYPRRHWRLAERIRESGLVLSEFPPGTRAYPGNFPRRNRIVTGMCQAVVVVEAALRSGSLVSARLALSQGREVMAVPGPVTQGNARGCHQLIRDGAALVESAEDILRELGLTTDPLLSCGNPEGELSLEEHTLLQELAKSPSSVDMLVSTLGQAVDEITVNLVSLEVMGFIFSEGGMYQLTPGAVERSQ